MDVGDGCRTPLEKFVEQTLDKDNWINCACWAGVSLDIGTGFQIFLRRFPKILADLEGCTPTSRPAQGPVAQRP
jgi:hypothetical protein